MKRFAVLAIFAASIAVATAHADDALRAAIDGPQRTPANKARDAARHPYEELTFFGLRPDMTVVEIWPGGGWWTEILAPYLKDRGAYYAATPDGPNAPDEARGGMVRFDAKLLADRATYGKVRVTHLWGGEFEIAPANSVDRVLTFRNLHNWLEQGTAEATLRAFYKVLKPGGVLGIDDHRGRADKPQDPKAPDGYVREDYAIALIEAAGFKLVAKSEINANPKDTKDYPAGVWTLPPTLRLGDKDHEKYLAIGEADGFTMTFVKPK